MRSPMDGLPVGQETAGPLDSSSLLAILRDLPTPELEASFRELDTLESSTSAYKLLVLSVLDEREVGRSDGALDTVAWVTWTARLTQSRARALVEPHVRSPIGRRSAPPRSKDGCPVISSPRS